MRPKNAPEEILIMDKPDANEAKKVWRWNLGGLGYSKDGVNGPYGTAITQDGAIVADFMTTGKLTGILIEGVKFRSIDDEFIVEINDEKEIQEFAVEDLKFRPRKKKVKISEQELKELKNLEDKKGDSKLDE